VFETQQEPPPPCCLEPKGLAGDTQCLAPPASQKNRNLVKTLMGSNWSCVCLLLLSKLVSLQ
jgi:hypothetical protein